MPPLLAGLICREKMLEIDIGGEMDMSASQPPVADSCWPISYGVV